LSPAAWIILLGAGLGVAACGADHGGLATPTAGTTAGAGGDVSPAGGAGGTDPGSTVDTTGSDGSTVDGSGSGGSDASGSGGAGGGAVAEDSGFAGRSDDDGGSVLASCVFHTPPWTNDAGTLQSALVDGGDAAAEIDAASSEAGAPTDGGAKSEGGSSRADAGDAGPAPSITVLVSPFLGPYLADSTGRVLYTYGADQPGDCNNIAVSGCEADCLIAWPVFDAGARTLATSLNDALFGTILRKDGLLQTTYYGWPLYYFKTDLVPGMLGGQAKSKTWHAATVIPAGVMIMKGATISRYLGDGAGHTLYVYDQDTKGVAAANPVAACKDTCLADHPPFYRSRLSVVSSLEPTDFSTFSPSSDRVQLAYKGAPLYYSAADARSGDQNGATTGWSVALP